LSLRIFPLAEGGSGWQAFFWPFFCALKRRRNRRLSGQRGFTQIQARRSGVSENGFCCRATRFHSNRTKCHFERSRRRSREISDYYPCCKTPGTQIVPTWVQPIDEGDLSWLVSISSVAIHERSHRGYRGNVRGRSAFYIDTLQRTQLWLPFDAPKSAGKGDGYADVENE